MIKRLQPETNYILLQISERIYMARVKKEKNGEYPSLLSIQDVVDVLIVQSTSVRFLLMMCIRVVNNQTANIPF